MNMDYQIKRQTTNRGELMIIKDDYNDSLQW